MLQMFHARYVVCPLFTYLAMSVFVFEVAEVLRAAASVSHSLVLLSQKMGFLD